VLSSTLTISKTKKRRTKEPSDEKRGRQVSGSSADSDRISILYDPANRAEAQTNGDLGRRWRKLQGSAAGSGEGRRSEMDAIGGAWSSGLPASILAFLHCLGSAIVPLRIRSSRASWASHGPTRLAEAAIGCLSSAARRAISPSLQSILCYPDQAWSSASPEVIR
jgi:hypothetical protein